MRQTLCMRKTCGPEEQWRMAVQIQPCSSSLKLFVCHSGIPFGYKEFIPHFLERTRGHHTTDIACLPAKMSKFLSSESRSVELNHKGSVCLLFKCIFLHPFYHIFTYPMLSGVYCGLLYKKSMFIFFMRNAVCDHIATVLFYSQASLGSI